MFSHVDRLLQIRIIGGYDTKVHKVEISISVKVGIHSKIMHYFKWIPDTAGKRGSGMT